MRIWMCRIFLFALLSLEISIAGAQGVLVHDAYVRATPPGQTNAAAYLILMNTTDTHRRLMGVWADVSEVAEIHRHEEAGGMMKMRRIGHIDVPANGKTVLAPSGLHIMLKGLNHQLKAGQTVMLELHFDNGQHHTVNAPVRHTHGDRVKNHQHKTKHKHD